MFIQLVLGPCSVNLMVFLLLVFNTESVAKIAREKFTEGILVKHEYFELLKGKKRNWQKKLHAVIFVVSSKKHSGQHLRMLAHLAEKVDNEEFNTRWMQAEDESELRQILLRDEAFCEYSPKS